MNQNDSRRGRTWTAALLLATSAAIAGGLALPRWSVAFFTISAVLATAGIVSAWRTSRRAGQATVLVLAAALVAGSLGAAHWGNSSDRFEAAVAEATTAPVGPTIATNVSTQDPQVVESDALTSQTQLESVVEKAATIDEVTDATQDARVALAQQYGYSPISGLDLDWSNAVAQDIDAAETVTVPLLGTDLPITSKVVFMATDAGMTTIEMASAMIDVDHAGMKMWQDGAQIKDVVVSNSDSTDGESTTIQSAGWSFNKFKSCLNRVGIMWATLSLLSAACAVACALTAGTACLACAAAVLGGNAGTISTCAAYART